MKTKMAVAIMLSCCMFLGACWTKQHETMTDAEEKRVDSLESDSLLATADTLLLDKESAETPIPPTVDEFFGDFIFNFDQSNRLQRNRIRFPFPVVEANGEKHFIERKDWQHHYLFLQEDFCTVLWNSHHQMELAEDTTLMEAKVEQIYLHSRQIDAFVFQRDSFTRQWMLVEERIVPFDNCELRTFLDFYRLFATDSIYQRHHVCDPLLFTTIDEEDEYKPIKGNINIDQWFEFQPDIPQDVLTNINYGQQFSRPNRILLQMLGINNGLQTMFTFVQDGEKWRLKEYEN